MLLDAYASRTPIDWQVVVTAECRRYAMYPRRVAGHGHCISIYLMTGFYTERLFEEFLVDNQVEYRRVPVEDHPTPDFEVSLSGHELAVEVKQIDMNAEDRRVLSEIRAGQTASYWIPNRVRGKLKHVSRQLQRAAAAERPTIVVLYSNVALYEHGGAEEVLEAMFGQRTVTVSSPVDRSAPPAVVRVHAGGARSVTPSQNTSLSAVGILGRKDAPIRLHVYHNPFARTPLPTALLTGLNARQFRVIQSEGQLTPLYVKTLLQAAWMIS